MYTIRLARHEDLAEILKIYAWARAFMASNGNPHQWGTEKPSPALLREDIGNQNLYAVIDQDRVCGAFAFLPGPDPTYRYIEGGTWRSDTPYAVIHRLAADGSGGIFSAVLNYCQERCSHLRIDTHRDNHVMHHLLKKHGFSRRGIIYLEDGDQRIAYDRI